MKLKLKNFRCYENNEFDFGENGLTLLSGSSGAGKSTLLMAIEFAITGNGTKLTSNGKKSCSVELILDNMNMSVLRTKTPNRLIVNMNNVSYEDDAAESIIQEKFGKIFKSVSYIPQNIAKSFVLMSPTERLEFLENFVFNNIDIIAIKEKAKKAIKDAHTTHSKTLGNLEFIDKMIKESKKPEEVPFPIKCTKENREKAIKNEEVRLKNSHIIIKRLEKEIKSITEQINNFNIFSAIQKEKKSNVEKIDNKIDNVTKDMKSLKESFIGEDELNSLSQKLKAIISQKEYFQNLEKLKEVSQKLEEMKSKEIEERRAKIEKIKSELWTGISKHEIDEQVENWTYLSKLQTNLNQLTKSFKEFKDPSEELEKVRSNISDLNKKLEKLEIQQQVYSCPHCTKKIKIDENRILQKYDDEDLFGGNDNDNDIKEVIEDTRNEIQSLKTKEKFLNVSLVKFIEMKGVGEKIQAIKSEIIEIIGEEDSTLDFNIQLQETIEYKKENLRREKSLNDLSENSFSSSVLIIQKNVEELKKKVESFDTNYENYNNINEEEVRNIINTENMKLYNIKKLEEDVKSLNNEKAKEEKELESININDINIDIESLKEEIFKKEEEIRETEKKRDNANEILSKIEKFKEYQKEVDNYNKIFKDKKEMEQREINDRKKYACCLLFKDKIQEAESIAIGNVINNINTHAQMYLEAFFPDNPISVTISAFKETKTTKETKPSVNLNIDYKGVEHDLTMLSGGELSRVILAFTLALAEIHNSPVILLDECTSSLDQELTGSVIDGLKENFNDKLVVLIAHQVVQGVFDKIINL